MLALGRRREGAYAAAAQLLLSVMVTLKGRCLRHAHLLPACLLKGTPEYSACIFHSSEGSPHGYKPGMS